MNPKKNIKMRFTALLLAICMAAFLVGCSSDGTSSEEESEENTTVYARITSIEDGVIELALGEMEEEDTEVSTDEDGETVDMSSESSEISSDTEDETESTEADDTVESTESETEETEETEDTADTASDDEDTAGDSDSTDTAGDTPDDLGDMPSGDMGDGEFMGGSTSSFTESGETLTLTITDDTSITRQTSNMDGGTAMGDVPSGDAPSGDVSGDAPSGDASGEAPSGDMSGEAPSGDIPSDVGGEEGEAPDADADADSSDAADSDSDTETDADSSDAADSDSDTETDADSSDAADTDSDADADADESSDDTTESDLEEITVDDLSVDDIIEVEYDSDGNAVSITVLSSGSSDMSGGMTGDMGGDMSTGSSDVNNGTAATTISEDGTYSDTTYTSEDDDENALRVDGVTVTLDSIIVQKLSGDSSDEDSGNFYGLNAALLVLNGAQVTIEDAEITTSVSNGNGVFSYGEGTVVTIEDSTIRTEGDNAGGIMTTGGGTTYAYDLDVETEGNSSAAIRTDRGGGTVYVEGGTYVTNGTGSPAVYSTADISVEDAVLTANASEAIVVEGENTVTLVDCTVTGSMEGTYSDDSENIHNVMIYQSTSGDAEEGTASFSMTGGSLTSLAGDMIYVTNTACTIYLENVELTLSDDILLCIEGNDGSRGWGSEGSNGGQVVFTAVDQTLTGTITVDDISTLEMTLSGSSTFEGTINPDGEAGEVSVTLEDGCTWTLTGDAYITSFTGDLDDVDTNGYTLYINGEAA